MATKKYRAGKLLNKFLKLINYVYMKHLFNYSIDNKQLQGIKPPYIVLANHTNFWEVYFWAPSF